MFTNMDFYTSSKPIWNLLDHHPFNPSSYGDYCEVEIYNDSRAVESFRDMDRVLNMQTYRCHICNIDIPKAHTKEHIQSAKHETSLKIMNIALDRTRSHIKADADNPKMIIEIKDTSFCAPCAVTVKNTDKNKHDASKKHINAVRADELLQKLLKIYENPQQDCDEIDKKLSEYDFDDALRMLINADPTKVNAKTETADIQPNNGKIIAGWDKKSNTDKNTESEIPKKVEKHKSKQARRNYNKKQRLKNKAETEVVSNIKETIEVSDISKEAKNNSQIVPKKGLVDVNNLPTCVFYSSIIKTQELDAIETKVDNKAQLKHNDNEHTKSNENSGSILEPVKELNDAIDNILPNTFIASNTEAIIPYKNIKEQPKNDLLSQNNKNKYNGAIKKSPKSLLASNPNTVDNSEESHKEYAYYSQVDAKEVSVKETVSPSNTDVKVNKNINSDLTKEICSYSQVDVKKDAELNAYLTKEKTECSQVDAREVSVKETGSSSKEDVIHKDLLTLTSFASAKEASVKETASTSNTHVKVDKDINPDVTKEIACYSEVDVKEVSVKETGSSSVEDAELNPYLTKEKTNDPQVDAKVSVKETSSTSNTDVKLNKDINADLSKEIDSYSQVDVKEDAELNAYLTKEKTVCSQVDAKEVSVKETGSSSTDDAILKDLNSYFEAITSGTKVTLRSLSEEDVEVKVDGSKYKLPLLNFLGFAATGKVVLCKLCILLNSVQPHKHKWTKEHISKMKTPLNKHGVRKVNSILFHCTLCNSVFMAFKSSQHVSSTTHEENVRKYAVEN